MKKLLSLLITAIALSTASIASADTLKMGVIDVNQILQKAPLMITMNADLIKKFKPRQDELNKMKTNLQNEIDQLSLNGAAMTTDEQNKLQDKILTDRAAADVEAANLQRDLTIAKNAALQKFMAKLSEAINKVAQEGQYDIIQQRSNIPYLNNKLDITQEVIKRLG